MSRNKMFDSLKGIGCIGVVFMHIKFPGIIGDIIHQLAQFAVPIFIMISGYYSYENSEIEIKRKLIKIFKIFLFAFACFTFYTGLKYGMQGNISEWLSDILSVKFFVRIFVFCTVDYAIPLWYLIAMVEVYLVWLLIVHAKLEKTTTKIIPILFIFQIALTVVCETMNLDWSYKTVFIASALPFFVLGYYFHEKQDHIEIVKDIHLILTLIMGLILTILPTIIQLPINFSCVGIALYAVSLFVFAMKNPKLSVGKAIIFIGENLSLDIYIFHVLVALVMGNVLEKIINVNSSLFLWINPIICLVFTILLALIMYKLKQKKLLPKWV